MTGRLRSFGALAAMVAASAAGFLLPLPAVAALLVLAIGAMRHRRAGFVAFAAFTIALDAALFTVLLPGPGAAHWGPLAVGSTGAWRGAAGGLRIAAVLGCNLAVLSWVPAVRLMDGLGLPRRAAGFLGAVVLAAHDLGRDAARLVLARRLDGQWPAHRLARARAAAALVPPLAVLALRRAHTRADALRLAGIATGPRFAPIVAVTAMALAARMVLAAGANVSLAYVVVFAGGLLFGARVGFWAGVLAMAISDVLLSGLYLAAFANAPAMGLLGMLGGALGRVDFSGTSRADRWAGRFLAASAGIASTLLFSVMSDAVTWMLVPEFSGDPGALRALVLAGLAFNAVPAVANAVLFAAVVVPLAGAARHAGVFAHPRRHLPREAEV
jgi:hypothetical protein